MLKDEITYLLKKAYREARHSRDFVNNFNFRVQNIISKYTNRQFVSHDQGMKDILYIRKLSKAKNYSTIQFILLVKRYVLKKIKDLQFN